MKVVTLSMQTPVKYLKRVGERVAASLAERGVETVEDLLYHLPFRYEDRLDPKPLSAYQPGEMASVIGEVRGTVLLRTRSGPIFEMTVGVAWRVGIIAVRLIDSDNTVKVSNAVQAFQYLNYLKNVEHQNIVAANNSWGWSLLARSRAARDAMAGLDQPGMGPILQVCAAGNSNNNNDLNPSYPASFDLPNIISVAATDWNDQYTDFTNFGAASVDLAAPGYNIVSTTPLDRFDALSGTSQAAPQVTGAAALVASAFPGLTTAQIKQRILNGVDPIGQIGTNGLKPTVTNGRLNVAKALAGDGDRTFAFQESDHRRHRMLGGNLDTHMHVIRH